MIRQTAAAILTNFNGSYIAVAFLPLLTLIAFVAPSDRVAPYNLLMSLELVAAAFVGMLAGTTLTEIKVKPLSYLLPGQEKSMAPAVLLVGIVVSSLYALLLLGRPMTVVAVPALQQALAAFGFGLGLFTLVVALCVITHDTAFTSLAGVAPFLLVVPAMWQERLASAWIALNVALARHPVASVLFAGVGVATIFYVLGSRRLSRHLCGAPFLPLKAYDNPFKIEDFRSRMKNGSFRRSLMTDSRASPGGLVLAALSRRVVGTPWDFLVLDTRASANRWEFGWKLISLVALLGFMALQYSLTQPHPTNPLGLLFLLVAVTFVFFPPTFRARLSPMLPVARRRHFKSFLAKAVSVYVFTFLAVLVLQLVVREAGLRSAVSAEIASLPLRGVIVAAATVPINCWAFTQLRSAVGFLAFMVAFVAIVVNAVGAAQQFLLGQSAVVLLLASAICWLPFVLIAWKRCFKDDLLLL
jgi:hypothetical protein